MKNLFSQLSFRIGFFFVTIVFMSILITASILLINERQKIAEELLTTNSVFAEYTSGLIYQQFINRPEGTFVDIVTELLKKNDDITQVSLVGVDGRILYQQTTGQPPSINVRNREGAIRNEFITDTETLGLIAASAQSHRIIPWNGKSVIEITTPLIEPSGSHFFSLQYLVTYDSLIKRTNEIMLQLIPTGLILTLSVILISIPLSIGITRPITHLQEATQKISKGDFNVKVAEKSEDEIGKLTQAFNKMTVDLQTSRKNIEDANQQLETKVAERTRELSEKLEELERFNKLVINRETAMIKLKEENQQLKRELASFTNRT